MATATTPAVSRETLEDRWVGLMVTTNPFDAELLGSHVDNSELYDKLHKALSRAVYGLMRSDVRDEQADGVIDGLYLLVRENAVRLVDEAGIADSPS